MEEAHPQSTAEVPLSNEPKPQRERATHPGVDLPSPIGEPRRVKNKKTARFV